MSLNITTCSAINLLAGVAFFVGSTLFLPALAAYSTMGVYCFMAGSLLLIIETLRGMG